MTHPLENLEQFVADHVKGPWDDCGQPITLYRHANERFVIVRQTSSGHEGLWRDEELADAGIYGAELDCQQLASTFVDRFCDYLSRRDIQHIVSRLQELLATER